MPWDIFKSRPNDMFILIFLILLSLFELLKQVQFFLQGEL
jgi:hypothetical protein